MRKLISKNQSIKIGDFVYVSKEGQCRKVTKRTKEIYYEVKHIEEGGQYVMLNLNEPWHNFMITKRK